MGLVLIAAALVGAACSAPAPTPTPTPTPTATPQPAAYRIVYDSVRFGGAVDGLVEVEFRLSLTNTGQLDGADIPVSISVDGEAERASDSIAELGAGESTTLVVAHTLSPGDHTVVFRVGESELRETVSIPAADIALTIDGYAVAGNRLMTIDARVENGGGLDAENIVVSALWRPLPGADGSPGRMESAATLERVAASGSATASFALPISTGAYTLTLTASTASPESLTDNNTLRRYLEAEYAQLTVEVASEEVTGYETDGDGLVELTLRVTNAGVGPTGPLAVGAACTEDAPAPCEAAGAVDSLAPSESAEAVVTIALPQGENALIVYAGANEGSYRWGERNAAAHAVIVPEKSPVELRLTALMEVSGYWSDGTANIDMAVTLANSGYQPLLDPIAVTIACYADAVASGASNPNCGGVTEMALADGFGPATAIAHYRIPMGMSVRASISGGEPQATAPTLVPERILGIERDLWECYSDRPAWKPTLENDFLAGCAGFEGSTIEKWDPTLSVRAWADPTGDRRYVDTFWESLDDLASLLGLQVERAAGESDANLKAYVGVPKNRNASIGFGDHCQEAAGCGGPDRIRGDAIASGSLSVWLNNNLRDAQIKHITLHEILHAVTGVRHASNPSSIMSYANWDVSSLGVDDMAFYRIHGHPLVKPGMTLTEVKELIVLADELLDPPVEKEISGIALAERAYAALIDTGSARFRVHGGYQDQGCADHNFNGWLSVADLTGGNARLNHFDGSLGGDPVFLIGYDEDAGWRYWRRFGVDWTQTTGNALSAATGWRNWLTGPLDLLGSVLRYAHPIDVGVNRHPWDIQLTLTLANHRNLPVSWARGATIEVSITLDAETYAMTGYRMDWNFAVLSATSCRLYSVTASQGEYGVDVPDPR